MSATLEPKWEHFPHGADVGIRGVGPTIDAAFEQVALALTAVIADPACIEARDTVEVSCEAPNPDDLLYDWIDAIVFEMATRGMLFGGYEVHVKENRLAGRLHGERVDRARHEPAVEVKGPTYTELRVAKHGADWLAQCVVDV